MKKTIPFFGLFLFIMILNACSTDTLDQESQSTNHIVPIDTDPKTSKEDNPKDSINSILNLLLKDTGDQMHTGGKDKTNSSY